MHDIDLQARSAAIEIEDIFCKSFDGGRIQRLAAVQTVIAAAIRENWNRRIEQISELSLAEARDAQEARNIARDLTGCD